MTAVNVRGIFPLVLINQCCIQTMNANEYRFLTETNAMDSGYLPAIAARKGQNSIISRVQIPSNRVLIPTNPRIISAVEADSQVSMLRWLRVYLL